MVWLLVFSIFFVIHVAYWLLLRRGLQRAFAQDATPGPSGRTEALPPLSVVVAARDEETDLPVLLDALIRQTHPRFEIVVVDDASVDATPQIVRRWAARYADSEHVSIRLMQVETPQSPRKKHALTRGIAAARHALLALTDADCAPPPDWLAALAARHAAAPEETLFLGYSPYRPAPGVLNRLARYETFVTGLYTAAAAGLGRPYMAVGRNMSYPKALFDRVDGFAHSLASLSGDDDLFVQHVARENAAPVRHVFGWATRVLTDAPASWHAWLRQKRRHASAGRFYAPAPRRHLALFHATDLALWLAPFFAGWPGAALLAARLAVQGVVLRRATRRLGEKKLLSAFPLWALLYALYTLLVVPLGLLRVPDEW